MRTDYEYKWPQAPPAQTTTYPEYDLIQKILTLGRHWERLRKYQPDAFYQAFKTQENDLACRLIAFYIFADVMPSEAQVRLAGDLSERLLKIELPFIRKTHG